MKIQLLKVEENDPDPEAIACYGFLRNDTHKVMLRFVEDRPIADVTIQFLDWVSWNAGKEGKKVLIVIWDDASWHKAEEVNRWVGEYNRQAKSGSGVKIVICELPVASPWPNNIEPCWKHAKKVILEPDRKLTAEETVARACKHFGCEILPNFTSKTNPECEILGSTPVDL